MILLQKIRGGMAIPPSVPSVLQELLADDADKPDKVDKVDKAKTKTKKEAKETKAPKEDDDAWKLEKSMYNKLKKLFEQQTEGEDTLAPPLAIKCFKKSGVPEETVKTVTCAEEITALQQQAAQVYLSDEAAAYIVALVQATRSHSALAMGASPRGSRGLYRAAKVWAAMQDRSYVVPDDVQVLLQPVLAHRLVLTGEARFSGLTAASVLAEIAAAVEVPPKTEELFHGR